MIEDDLKRYRELRASYASARAQLSKREQLSTGQRAAVAELDAKITQLDSQVADAVDDLQRSGRLDPTAAKIAGATRTGGSKAVHTGDAGDWATRAADAIWAANGFKNGEVRGITASSIDLPALVLPQVVAMERPKRIIDLLVDRMESPSNATEYWQQTVRTNNAAMTADLATKPTSVFTVQPVQDRLRVLAHLSEPIPNRLWLDYSELRQWLITELYQGLLDALDEQVINGDGTGENFTGILTAAGTTAVAYDTVSVASTLRGALTVFETAGVQATGWVLNPSDAAALDLLREGGSPDLFVLPGGYSHGPADSGNVFGTIPRLVSPRVPAGKALLADWSKARLFTRGGVLTMMDPFSGFAENTTILRCETRIGLGLTRPDAFAVIALA